MFTIVRADTLGEQARAPIARIFAEGFSQWLSYFSKDSSQIERAFAHIFVLEQFYVALADGKVAAMAACTDGIAFSVRIDSRELRKHFGFFKGSLAGIVLKKVFQAPMKNPSPLKGSIEFVGTGGEYRGQGAASQLIRHILAHTPYEEYVIEEVADTNIPAMKLYQKLGFVEYKRDAVPPRRARKIGINHIVSLKYARAAAGNPYSG